MGDYPMARSQTEMDCLFTLLKVRMTKSETSQVVLL